MSWLFHDVFESLSVNSDMDKADRSRNTPILYEEERSVQHSETRRSYVREKGNFAYFSTRITHS